jgi:hypothetical protein
MSLPDQLLGSILSAVISGAIVWIATRLRARLPARRLWRLHDPSAVLIALPDVRNSVIGIGEARALATIAPSLARAYGGKLALHRVLFATQGIGSHLDQDIIVLGGPGSNSLTRRLFEMIPDLPARFVDDSLVWQVDNSTEIPFDLKITNNEIVTDYGLILRTPNPYKEDRILIIMAGIETAGTEAAARFFVDHMPRLKYWNSRNVAAITKAEVIDGFVHDTQLVRLTEL